MKAYKETVRKYYKYGNWTQPVLSGNNSSDIMWVSATTEGQGGAWKAFDGDAEGYGWITNNNTTTGSLNCNINEEIYIYSITITAMSNEYGYTSTVGIFNANEQVGETKTFFTGKNGGNKSLTWTFSNPIKTNFLRFYATGVGWCALNEISLNAKTLGNGTSSDYDFYKDINEYKVVKNTVRTYYKRFSYTSDSTFTVPSGITKLKVDCVGAKGYTAVSGSYIGNGGNGGRVECDLAVSAGQVLNITVGAVPTTTSQSYNASDIRIGGTTLNDRVIVAGGGGSGVYKQDPRGVTPGVANGGAGGGLVGGNGGNAGADRTGQGGTQSSGGLGAYSSYPYHPFTAGNGEFGLGGTGSAGAGGIAGAGGAGWYGGGGAGCNGIFISAGYSSTGAAAGGGSSYTNSSCTNIVHTQGYQNGAGYVNIDYPSTSSDYDYYVDENTYKAFNI